VMKTCGIWRKRKTVDMNCLYMGTDYCCNVDIVLANVNLVQFLVSVSKVNVIYLFDILLGLIQILTIVIVRVCLNEIDSNVVIN
jgi:hypothetical protein